MKLTKISLNQLSDADLNEREMCRLLGGGTPGCCQCGCHYTASSSSNQSANNAEGYTSDPEATTPCDTTPPPDDTNPSYTYGDGCTWAVGGMECPGEQNCGTGPGNTCTRKG
jgi:natural product precursor